MCTEWVVAGVRLEPCMLEKEKCYYIALKRTCRFKD